MIPFSIMSVTLHIPDHFRTVRVLDLSPDGFTFRLADPLPEKPVSFEAFFYSFSGNRWNHCQVTDFLLERTDPEDFCVSYRILTEDPVFIRYARALAADYGNYIRLKLYEEPAELSRRLTAYPAEKEQIFAENWEVQRAQLLSGLTPDPDWGRLLLRYESSLALSLDTPWDCQAFLQAGSFEEYYQGWIRGCGLTGHPLAEILPETVCIGNSFCPQLFPSAGLLTQMLDCCTCRGLTVSVVFPPVPEGLWDRFAEYFPLLAAAAVREIAVNDWGTALALARTYPGRFSLTAGELLVKRRKDPRFPWKSGWSSPQAAHALGENSFNGDFFAKELREYCQMTGCRSEICGYEYLLPEHMENDLVLPFYQTNTAGFCTLKACCEKGARGRQAAEHPAECAYFCRKYGFLYPSFLEMAGIGNSLFGFDRRSLTDSRYLETFLAQGVRRILLRIV